MTIYEALAEVRKTIEEKLNPMLDESGLDAVKIQHSRVTFGSEDNTLVVYPTGSTRSTYKDDAGSGIMQVTIEFYLSDEYTAEALDTLEMYYSVVTDFLHYNTFCQDSTISESTLFRMDEGEAANGFAFLITVKIATAMDYGW